MKTRAFRAFSALPPQALLPQSRVDWSSEEVPGTQEVAHTKLAAHGTGMALDIFHDQQGLAVDLRALNDLVALPALQRALLQVLLFGLLLHLGPLLPVLFHLGAKAPAFRGRLVALLLTLRGGAKALELLKQPRAGLHLQLLVAVLPRWALVGSPIYRLDR